MQIYSDAPRPRPLNPTAALSRNWNPFVTASWRGSVSIVLPGRTLDGREDRRHRGQGCGILRKR